MVLKITITKLIKTSIFLILILIPGAIQLPACPSASIVHGWSCVDDVECPNWQYCDLWDHICRTREGYCGQDLVCGNSWEECTNETHKCFPLQGYCGNESDCDSGMDCILNECKPYGDNPVISAGNGSSSLEKYLDYGAGSPFLIAGVIILAGLFISFYINKKFS